jgi:hypothetical protein
MGVYRITGWGQPVGIGATGAVYAQVSAVCKKNGQCPYYVPNELVSAELGRILRLPVPPGFIVLDTTQGAYYASLDFNLTGVALPPVIAANFIATFRHELAAIVVFDIFIANPDRHPGNLSADYNPPTFNLFDHSHALLGSGTAGTGAAALHAAENSVALNANHAVIAGVDNEQALISAIERVELIPDYFIDSIVQEATQYGLLADESHLLRTFLRNRKMQVRHLISSNKGLFPGIAQWSVL